MYDDDGNMYYYNESTGESSWDPPTSSHETKSSSRSDRRKKRLRALEVKLNDKTKRVNDLTGQIRELKKKFKEHEERSKSQIDELSTNIEALKATIESKDRQRESLVRAQREELNRRDENLSALKKGHEQKVQNLKQTIVELQNDETMKELNRVLKAKESDLISLRAELKDRLERFEAVSNELDLERSHRERYVLDTDTQIDELKESLRHANEDRVLLRQNHKFDLRRVRFTLSFLSISLYIYMYIQTYIHHRLLRLGVF